MQRRSRLTTLLAALSLAALAVVPATAGAAGDLSLTITDSPDPVAVGQQLVYEVAVSNAGPDAVNGVAVDLDLDNQLDLASVTPSQGSCQVHGKKASCDIGSIAANGSALITVRATASKPGTVISSATATSADPDPVPANNTQSAQTAVVAAPAAPTCAGKPATIVGTDGADQITGTPKRDVIVSLGGDDTIDAGGGKDLICAAAGNDVIAGKGSDDVVKGGGGRDRLKGGAGNDQLKGGGGADRLAGGGGNDLLAGGGGKDRCKGGPGTDTTRSC